MASVTGEQKFNQKKDELEKNLDERLNADNLPDANIMVVGITGTGKSTLINAVFGSELAATGSGQPVTDHISEYKSNDTHINIWDTIGLELDSEKTKESIKSIRAKIASKAESEDPYDRIHAIWYCINSGSNRYQGAELEFIKELYTIGVPFIIVLTQCSGDEEEVNAFEAEIKKINSSMNMDDIKVVQVLALPVKYRGQAEPIPAFGLDELVNVTLQLLPDFIKSGFIAAQKVSQNQKRSECEGIICEYVRAAQLDFWDRVPLVNVGRTGRNIMNMFRKIGEMYNTVLSEESIKEIMDKCHVDKENKFFGLISPIDMGYSKKITALLEQKKDEGFSVEVSDVESKYRAARMIAFYGYTFVDAIEELWRNLTEEQLKNVDMVVRELIGIINAKLKARVK
ncbi:GTPase family protein [Butyrivibrio sp. YAB3001]|uniref:GTPase family protein n=1 Tax=Butyrivibrio sp. YAB3001 TaxID=1520812 RepID=UPI0008F68013|nr:GTPase domain-containing protein [Butyrivibrio sp. YAB3001]SFC55870.1 50S ribosome-binding GTPase [Butyrivibrio sp. YAB3001]